jgi:hypothetical protein
MSCTLRSTLTTLILVLTLIHPAAAQTPHSPRSQRATPYWDVTYWNNTSLSDEPAVRTTDRTLDHDWGTGSPHPDVNADRFSARWAGTVELTGGRYRFAAVADDGIRVTVGGDLIIDEWTDHPRRRFTGETELPSGAHRITVEYYENGGDAVAQVSWELAPTVLSPWHGAYYGNRRFEGAAYERFDDALDFDWGYGSPAPGIPSDGFSVSWWRNVTFSAGVYRFTASSDDGIEVYLYRLGETLPKRRVVIDDAWYDHPEQTFVGEIDLKEGDYRVVVKYYENTGLATARVTWNRMSGFPTGWTGEYFDNVSFDDVPRLIRQDEEIDFDWGYESPARTIGGDRFSIRWTRIVHFEPGFYRFTASTDDGVCLWVDGRLVIDNWHDQAVTPHSGTSYVVGDAALKMEYYENQGLAAARLSWERVGPEPSPPAAETVVVDDTDPGFVRTRPVVGLADGGRGTRRPSDLELEHGLARALAVARPQLRALDPRPGARSVRGPRLRPGAVHDQLPGPLRDHPSGRGRGTDRRPVRQRGSLGLPGHLLVRRRWGGVGVARHSHPGGASFPPPRLRCRQMGAPLIYPLRSKDTGTSPRTSMNPRFDRSKTEPPERRGRRAGGVRCQALQQPNDKCQAP